ncbi:MAG: hypothetical protein AB8H12_08705 [Lewinella sp.]
MAENQLNNEGQDQEVLNHLRRAIEEKLEWGHGGEWNGSDFEHLSNLVFNETGKRLSVSTLKRLWGRTSANVRASRTTLDILSAFVGKESWRVLKREVLPIAGDTAKTKTSPRVSKLILGATLVILLLLAMASIGFLYPSVFPDRSTAIDLSRVTFSVEKVTTGIPNTVIFRYDLDGQRVDSLELQQSWDTQRREVLDPTQNLVTSTYHSPGYYLAKLIADGTVLDSQHVYLPSNGVEVVEIREEGEEVLYRPQIPWIWQQGSLSYLPEVKERDKSNNLLGYQLTNLLPAPVINKDTFTLEMELRLTQGTVDNHCNPVLIFITGAEDIYFFGLGHPGCAGEFQCFFGGSSISGKDHDLSSLGFLAEEWVDIEVTKSGNELSLKVNDNTLMISEQAPGIGQIGGVSLQSQQLIELRRLSLADSFRQVNLLGEAFR